MTPDDADDLLLRYFARLDGFATGVLIDLVRSIGDALSTVESLIGGGRPEDAPFTIARHEAVRRELLTVHEALTMRIVDRIGQAVVVVLDTSASVVEAVAEGTLRVGMGMTVPVERLAAVRDLPFDGRSWRQWGAKLADDTTARVESELRQASALGEAMPAIGKRIERVSGLSKTSAERLARTAVTSTANRAMAASMEALGGDAVVGWRFMATLDGRTSAICRGLDQRVFRKGDPSAPWPPRHPNCRSIMLPLTDLEDEPDGFRPFVRSDKALREMGPEYRRLAKERVGEDAWKRLSEAERREEIRVSRTAWQRENVGRVKASTSWPEWLAMQPEAFQREQLGPARFAAWKRGLPIGEMATYGRELTVAELRRLYPDKMRGL